MPAAFWRRVIGPNLLRYAAVIAACLAYAFGLSLSGPTWYRSEAVLAFKNRTNAEQIDITRLSEQPLPVSLQETPIEQQYEMGNLLYSKNIANRVIGDRLEELYDPEEYDSLTDFYDKFLMQLDYDYDGDENVLRLGYTYKDPQMAAEFCNEFADALEQFLAEMVGQTRISSILKGRADEARGEARVADADMNRIADLYGIPDLIEAPREWVKTYTHALERSYISEAELQSVLAALMQVRENRRSRNLLEEPAGTPDTTIIQDLILAVLRYRLAMVNAVLDVSAESASPQSPARERLRSESAAISGYLEEQYRLGLDVESTTLLLKLQEHIVENYLYEARAEATYARLEQLPRLEAEIRPAIRAVNVANATVSTLENLSAWAEIGEEYGIDPLRTIDPALVPEKPIQPAWRILAYLLPTMLFLSTLWFSVTARIIDEIPRSANDTSGATEGRE
jgi:phage gp36-like protein